jgi:hypothetical protein
MKPLRFSYPEEVEARIQMVLAACGQSVAKVVELASELEPIDWFYAIKFKKIGRDGLFDRKQNVIEQVNQTFTYLVTLQGIKELLSRHPESRPYWVNLGARRGPDILSEDGAVIAEAFAAVRPTNNRKLLIDLQRCSNHPAHHKYVFFFSPGIPAGFYEHSYGFPDIAVYRLELPTRENQLYENGELNERKWLTAAAHNPAFDFLNETREDIYTLADGKPFYDAR